MPFKADDSVHLLSGFLMCFTNSGYTRFKRASLTHFSWALFATFILFMKCYRRSAGDEQEADASHRNVFIYPENRITYAYSDKIARSYTRAYE